MGLLKLLFRLRVELDKSPKNAQKILAPYIAGICRRSGSSFQRWSRGSAGEDVDTEAVELFILDCVLELEVGPRLPCPVPSVSCSLPDDSPMLCEPAAVSGRRCSNENARVDREPTA